MITQIRQALDRLDPVDREVLALRHFEELSNHETAALLEACTRPGGWVLMGADRRWHSYKVPE